MTTDEPLPEPECADTANCVIAETPAEGMQRGDHSEEAIYAKKIELLETAVRKKVTAVLTEEAWIEEVENLVKEQARRVEVIIKHILFCLLFVILCTLSFFLLLLVSRPFFFSLSFFFLRQNN